LSMRLASCIELLWQVFRQQLPATQFWNICYTRLGIRIFGRN